MIRKVILHITLVMAVLLFGAYTHLHAQAPELADQYWNQAEAAQKAGRYLEAAQLYEKSAEAEKSSPSPRLANLGNMLAGSGFCYNTIGQYDKALKHFEESLAIVRKLWKEGNIAVYLNYIGQVYHSRGQYDKALKHYEEALVIARKMGQEDKIATFLNYIGQVYHSRGQYDKALKHFEEALAISRKLGQEDKIATFLNNIGLVYGAWGQYDKALKHYEEALVIARKLGKEGDIAMVLNNIGGVYGAWGQYDKALKHYEEALVITRKLGKEAGIAMYLNNIGMVYNSRGQYDKALKHYEEALVISRKLGKEEGVIPKLLNNIGLVYHSWGQYDKALKHYEEALAIDRKLEREGDIAMVLNNIGQVYGAWGQFEKALKHYEEALAIDRKLGREGDIVMDLNSIGQVYGAWGQYDKALKHYEEALAISRKLGQDDKIATFLNNIGLVYYSWGQYDKALKHYEEALAISRKLGKEGDIAIYLNNIGLVYGAWGQYDRAIKHYEEALVITRKLGQEDKIATGLINIGSVYYSRGQYDKADANFNASIELIEKLRKTATGTARRDYLASQIGAYRFLISSNLRGGLYPNAFSIMEASRAKLLTERLAGGNNLPTSPSAASVQQNLPADTAIISFANTDLANPAVIVITKNDITGQELDKKKFMASLPDDYQRSIMQLLSQQRGLKVVSKTDELTQKPQTTTATSFDDMINYYRSQLTDTSSGINRVNRGLAVVDKRGGAAKGGRLDRMIYDYLVQPLSKQLAGKKRLIIIPDGVLSYLPFETLVDENNNYLVEKYAISYTQSMGIMETLAKRSYPSDRKPMLAFGGAAYDEVSYKADMITNERQLLVLAKDVNDATRSKRSLGEAYASLGMGKWDNLPGTLSEVETIARTIKGTKIITGRDVNEGRVKRLSKNGELSKYKVVHFATHGIVVPELPELSAIVLSQIKNQPEGEDGYLRMDKIEQLKLKADFVNLSACETGLGKIFGGEGVVGLTQSFLLAGANGLSASLWSVNDISTSKFMVALYNLVEQKKIGYRDAITEIKRDFIQGKFGEEYKSPYYWAPFVYYGK